MAELTLVNLPLDMLDECHSTLLMIGQHWFRFMAWCHQATSHYLSQCWWSDPDLCCHMASLGPNELLMNISNTDMLYCLLQVKMVKIFIGNLDEYADENKLRRQFEQFGKVSECDILNKYGFVVSWWIFYMSGWAISIPSSKTTVFFLQNC